MLLPANVWESKALGKTTHAKIIWETYELASMGDRTFLEMRPRLADFLNSFSSWRPSNFTESCVVLQDSLLRRLKDSWVDTLCSTDYLTQRNFASTHTWRTCRYLLSTSSIIRWLQSTVAPQRLAQRPAQRRNSPWHGIQKAESNNQQYPVF